MVKNLNMKKIVLVLIVLVVVAVLVVCGYKWRQKEKSALNPDSFYAVFLTNSQIYFGHLSNVNDQYITLTNIYYLQLAQPLQSTSSSTATTTTPTTAGTGLVDNSSQSLTLIKLGKELHGPKDVMKINRDSVQFYEELKNDSKVVQAINQSK
ncbi:MAG: hypothetical protein NTW50_02705 [Candidatus Berkelbacteria bacterium]|nr:hypothetical protein [Candidatus Berkelbacteria bacterium]